MDGQRSRHKTDPHFRKGVHQGVDPYETGGFIVPFFDRGKVKRLSAGYDIPAIDEFEEENCPGNFSWSLCKRNNGQAQRFSREIIQR